jgi:hypothetical protein
VKVSRRDQITIFSTSSREHKDTHCRALVRGGQATLRAGRVLRVGCLASSMRSPLSNHDEAVDIPRALAREGGPLRIASRWAPSASNAHRHPGGDRESHTGEVFAKLRMRSAADIFFGLSRSPSLCSAEAVRVHEIVAPNRRKRRAAWAERIAARADQGTAAKSRWRSLPRSE